MARYRAKNLSISGLKPIKERLNNVVQYLDGEEIYPALGRAVKPLQTAAQNNARLISGEIAVSIHLADRQPPSRPRKKTVLVVAHKSETMRRWTGARSNRSPKAKVSPGNEVSESLASMFELGTSRMPARAYFKPAVDATKAEVISNVKTELEGLIELAVQRQVNDD